MEVHHSSHSGKTFKDYFFEFLMLFLAVTLGFFAESLREHIVEKKREKDYMKEIVENLIYDTTRCSRNLVENTRDVSGLDSLRTELKEAIAGKVNGNALYYYTMKYTGDFGLAVFNTSAITELKNSGSLRLIGNKKLVNEISDYYERKLIAANYFIPSALSRDAFMNAKNELFSMVGLDDYLQSLDSTSNGINSIEYDYRKILGQSPALKLLNSDPKSFERFYTELYKFEVELKRYVFWLKYVRTEAIKLIDMIRLEYHLN